MFNQNYSVKFYGTKAVAVVNSTEKMPINCFDKFNYLHDNNQIYNEEISYGAKAFHGDDNNHTVIVSFYSEKPLEGFEFDSYHCSILSLQDFAKKIASQHIPGEWGTEKQQAYAAAIADNYFSNRD